MLARLPNAARVWRRTLIRAREARRAGGTGFAQCREMAAFSTANRVLRRRSGWSLLILCKDRARDEDAAASGACGVDRVRRLRCRCHLGRESTLAPVGLP